MDKENQKKFYKDIMKLFLYGKTSEDASEYQELIKKSYETTTEELKKQDSDFKDVEFKSYENFSQTEDSVFYKDIDALIDSGIDMESLVLDYIKQFSEIKTPELINNGFDPKGLLECYEKMKTKFSAHNSNDKVIEL